MDYNVVLITVDCLRQDHVGHYGYYRNTTSYIDSIAEKSMVFKNMISTGNCTPMSFPAILASTDPKISDSSHDLLPKYSRLISQKLKKNNHSTIGIHSNPFLSKHFGYGRGFDIFEDMAGSVNKGTIKRLEIQDLFSKVAQKVPYFHQAKSILNLYRSVEPFANARKIVDKSIKCLDQVENPFFLWTHFMDAHFPYLYPEDEDKHVYTEISKIQLGKSLGVADKTGKATGLHLQNLIDLYDTNLRFIDGQLGRLLEYLESKEMFDNTILIITSDHGEEFMEHGNLFHYDKLYNELIRVPLIIRHPEIHQNVTIHKLVSHLDIAPSILDFLGIKEEGFFKGKSVFKRMENKTEDYVISEGSSVTFNKKPKRLFSCTTNNMKYIYNIDDEIFEVFDLIKDPQENFNISDEINDDIYSEILKTYIMSKVGQDELSKSVFFNSMFNK
ncbi:MAG: sulfatase [Candidatus Bathyarchaeota archaeon]|nr:sulfatase [Candidatus Bathyarchaeota archaeon]